MPATDAGTTADRTELNIRLCGGLFLAGGASVGVGTVLVAAAFRESSGRPFPIEWLMGLVTLAAVLTLSGILERVGRPVRAAISLALATQSTIIDHQAHIDATLAGLAAALPPEFDKRWWVGYGAAAAELAGTGTDGIPARNSFGRGGDVLKLRRNRPPAAE